MRQRVACTVVLMVAVAAASGCGEKQEAPSAPSAPEFHTITGTSSGCDITHLNQLVQSYFSDNDRRKTVKDTVTAMDAATDFSSEAQRLGFVILANIDTVVSNATAGDPGTGSDLVNHVLLCMYQSGDGAFPTTFPENFTIPLTPALHGQFHVKPASSGDGAAVVSRDTLHPFSGVAPLTNGVVTGTWASVLVDRTDRPDRVLIYGQPGSTTTTYNWKTVPHDADFASVAVGICVNEATETTTLLNDEHIGLLPFVDATFLNPVTGGCSSTALLDSNSPTMFARRLLRMGADLFGARALWATALSPGGLGGSSGGIRTEYGPSEVDSVHFQFVQQPTSTKVNATITPPVTIRATAFLTAGGSKLLPNVSIRIGAINNNGATLVVNGTTTRTTDANGIATYNDLSETKSGGSRLIVLQAVVNGRPAIDVGSATSARFNIAPK